MQKKYIYKNSRSTKKVIQTSVCFFAFFNFFLQTSVTFGHCDRNKTTYVKFVYLMSFNHFQLARVNQLLQITYGQSAVFLNCQGKQIEY